ncbi:hypothetical protein ACLOJK_002668 [Asimina triloba]
MLAPPCTHGGKVPSTSTGIGRGHVCPFEGIFVLRENLIATSFFYRVSPSQAVTRMLLLPHRERGQRRNASSLSPLPTSYLRPIFLPISSSDGQDLADRVMQADQTGLSLRPGGGVSNRGNRLLAPRFDASGFGNSGVGGGSSASSDPQHLRPHGTTAALKVGWNSQFDLVFLLLDVASACYLLKTTADLEINSLLSLSVPNRETGTAGDSWFDGRERVRYTRDQLLQLREVVNVPEDILKVKKEIEAEVFGEDQSWGRGDANLQGQPQSRYAEPDNRDWRGRSGQLPASGEERSWENRETKEYSGRAESYAPNSRQQEGSWQDHQFSRAQMSSAQGGGAPAALIKAEAPWSARRGNLSENERVLKTVKG